MRRVTSLWPRSEAERFADRMWPDRPQPAVGDDSFDIGDVEMRHVPEGYGCICFWTDPSTWTRYGSAVEPGSQMEPNPECPVHFPESESPVWPAHGCTDCSSRPHGPKCAPAATPAAGVSPAGESVPQPTPPAGHQTWTCAECRKVMDTPNAAVSQFKDGMFCSVKCADKPTELGELIAEVLDQHYPQPRGFNRDGTQHIRCMQDNRTACRRAHLVADWQGWREHVAEMATERIQRATPPAPFTHGDLSEAAQIVSNAARNSTTTWDEYHRLTALARRLADASDADPNP